MSGVEGAVPLAGELPLRLVLVVGVRLVVATARVEGVGAADEQLVVVGPGQHADVVVAVVARLALDQTQLGVTLPRGPGDSLKRRKQHGSDRVSHNVLSTVTIGAGGALLPMLL